MAFEDLIANLGREPSDARGRFNPLSLLYPATSEGQVAGQARRNTFGAQAATAETQRQEQLAQQQLRRTMMANPQHSEMFPGGVMASPEEHKWATEQATSEGNIARTGSETAHQQQMTAGEHYDLLQKQALNEWLQTHHPNYPTAGAAEMGMRMEAQPSEIAQREAVAAHTRAQIPTMEQERSQSATRFAEQSQPPVGPGTAEMPETYNRRQALFDAELAGKQAEPEVAQSHAFANLVNAASGTAFMTPEMQQRMGPVMKAGATQNPVAAQYLKQNPPGITAADAARRVDAATRGTRPAPPIPAGGSGGGAVTPSQPTSGSVGRTGNTPPTVARTADKGFGNVYPGVQPGGPSGPMGNPAAAVGRFVGAIPPMAKGVSDYLRAGYSPNFEGVSREVAASGLPETEKQRVLAQFRANPDLNVEQVRQMIQSLLQQSHKPPVGRITTLQH